MASLTEKVQKSTLDNLEKARVLLEETKGDKIKKGEAIDVLSNIGLKALEGLNKSNMTKAIQGQLSNINIISADINVSPLENTPVLGENVVDVGSVEERMSIKELLDYNLVLEEQYKKAKELFESDNSKGTEASALILNVNAPQHHEWYDTDEIKNDFDFQIPGILVVYNEDKGVLSIEGADNLVKRAKFIKNAINKGKANIGKSDEEMAELYKRNTDIYIKFREMSEIGNTKIFITSLVNPLTVKGQSIILKLEIQHKDTLI